MKRKDLDNIYVRLVYGTPVFMSVSRLIRRQNVTPDITETMEVGIENGYFSLKYNGDWLNGMSDDEVEGVFYHALMHIILEQFMDFRIPKTVKDNPEFLPLWDLALDLSINSEIPHVLPEEAPIAGEGDYKDFPLRSTADQHWDIILKNLPPSMGGGGGGGCGGSGSMKKLIEDIMSGKKKMMDSHKYGKGSVQENFLKHQLKQALEHGVRQSMLNNKKDGWGKIPLHIQEYIKDIIKPRPSDPRSWLRHFVQKSVSSHRRTSIRKVNRRFPYVYPGVYQEKESKVLISIDESGSMCDETVFSFLKIIEELADHTDFEVLHFDCAVNPDNVETFKKGQKIRLGRRTYGGTDFNPVIEFGNTREVDGHIIVSDLIAPEPNIRSKKPLLWIQPKEAEGLEMFKPRNLLVI